jgi:hypothetical protein
MRGHRTIASGSESRLCRASLVLLRRPFLAANLASIVDVVRGVCEQPKTKLERAAHGRVVVVVDCVLPWPRREPSLRRRWSMTLFDREGRRIEIDRGHSAIHKTRADTAYLRVMTDVPRLWLDWAGAEPCAVGRRAQGHFCNRRSPAHRPGIPFLFPVSQFVVVAPSVEALS